MATTTSNKRKKAVAATVAAAAILLAGTFAWTSISQQALNESAGIVNVGGRLHDDFDGENKDVYVENFTDPLDGGQPIYARIRLDEYMEVGPDAGGVDDGDGNETEFTPVVANTDRDNVDTWITHIPNTNTTDGAACDTDPAGTHVIHEHWEWEMGGKTVFMPTFNKDKDSLESDINGTYHGTDRDADTHDKVYYDDYVTYTTATDGKVVEGAVGTTAIKESVYQRKADATYDDDTDNEPGGQKRTENEIHTAKETASAKVILMKDWNGEAGDFWVYDEDGWAYWANPIMPGEATGLLLSGINMEKNPGEKCYYGINVVAQFATVGDWGYFNDEKTPDQFDGTKEALELLKTASENVAKVTVTNKDNQTTVDLEAGNDNTVTFSAATFVGESEKTGTYDWAVYNADLEEVTTSTITDNGDGTVTLTVGSDEKNDALIIAAKSTTYPGAVGVSSIAVNQPAGQVDTKLMIKKSAVSEIGYITQAEVYLTDAEGKVLNAQPEFMFEVTKNGIAVDAGDYLVTKFSSTENPNALISGVTIPAFNDGIYNVKASYKGEDGVTYYNTFEMNSASALISTPTNQMQYTTSDAGDTIPTITNNITHNSQTEGVCMYNILNGAWNNGILMNMIDVRYLKGADDAVYLNYPVNITVTKTTGETEVILSPDEYLVDTLEGKFAGTEMEWQGYYTVFIPAEENQADQYKVYVTFTGDGTYGTEKGVEYGAIF